MKKNNLIKGFIIGTMISMPVGSCIFNNTEAYALERGVSGATSAVTQAESSKSPGDIASARELVNALPESGDKDGLQTRLNAITDIAGATFEKKSATANVDVYIKCENLLSLSLNTNSITFDDFSGVEDMEKLNAVTLDVNSSLPYEVNATLPTEITGASGVTMDKQILEIRANGESSYNKFASLNTPVKLLDNQPAGNGKSHGIDINLKGGVAHKKDNYKATIKFEVKQK